MDRLFAAQIDDAADVSVSVEAVSTSPGTGFPVKI